MLRSYIKKSEPQTYSLKDIANALRDVLIKILLERKIN